MLIMTCNQRLVKSDANDYFKIDSKTGKAKKKSSKNYYSKYRISAL
jgi:hypothetical protein